MAGGGAGTSPTGAAAIPNCASSSGTAYDQSILAHVNRAGPRLLSALSRVTCSVCAPSGFNRTTTLTQAARCSTDTLPRCGKLSGGRVSAAPTAPSSTGNVGLGGHDYALDVAVDVSTAWVKASQSGAAPTRSGPASAIRNRLNEAHGSFRALALFNPRSAPRCGAWGASRCRG
jgi:hypothetical protein